MKSYLILSNWASEVISKGKIVRLIIGENQLLAGVLWCLN